MVNSSLPINQMIQRTIHRFIHTLDEQQEKELEREHEQDRQKMESPLTCCHTNWLSIDAKRRK